MSSELVHEVLLGSLALLLLSMTLGMTYYVYRHRVTKTVEERHARGAAVGFSIFFGALSARAIELWWETVALRMNWWPLPGTGSALVYFLILSIALFGVILALKALHPWPLWFTLLFAALVIPMVLVLL